MPSSLTKLGKQKKPLATNLQPKCKPIAKGLQNIAVFQKMFKRMA